MSRTRTSSRWFSSKVLSSTASGSAYSPAKISPYARATRRGRVAQALAVGVLPDRDEQLADRGLGPRPVELRDRAPVGQGDRAGRPGGAWPSPVARSRPVLSSGPRRPPADGSRPGACPCPRPRPACASVARPRLRRGRGRRRPARRRPRLPGRRGRGPPVGRRAVVGRHRVRRLRAGPAVGQATGLRGPRLVGAVAPAWGAPACGAPACGRVAARGGREAGTTG